MSAGPALRSRSLAVEAEEIAFMTERNLAGELSLLATEVDSLAKSLVQARAELAREADRRTRADTKAEELRQELGHAKRRAQTAERGLGRLTAGIEATAHAAQGYRHELETRLEEAEQVNERLRQQVQRKERQRRALEANLREVMENLGNAAHEAQGSGVVTGAALPEEATLVPPQRSDGGW
jgi:chromosome segregation ATPase